jgi:hypothetical protein
MRRGPAREPQLIQRGPLLQNKPNFCLRELGSPAVRRLRRGVGSNADVLPTVKRLLDTLNQYARLPHQRPQLPALLDGFARVQAVLERVLVALRGARPRRAAVHSTTSFSAHRRRPAERARTRFGQTAQARLHRTCVTRVIARHFFVCFPLRRIRPARPSAPQ